MTDDDGYICMTDYCYYRSMGGRTGDLGGLMQIALEAQQARESENGGRHA